MFLYRNILKQGLIITWQNKYLWFFGFFVALLGNGGIYEIIFKALRGETSQDLFVGLRNFVAILFSSDNLLANIVSLFKNDPANMIILLGTSLIMLIVFIFIIWMIMVSQAAIINNSANIINKNNKSLGVKDSITIGRNYFWPVLGLNAVVKIVIGLIFLLIGWSVIINDANLVYVILFIVLIPIAIIISFIIKYAIGYVVIKGKNFIDSITAAWRLFIKNWLVSIEMAFILFFINFLVGLGILLLTIVLSIPLIFLIYLFYVVLSLSGFWLMISLAFIVLLLIVVISGSALATFQTVSWTGLYLELINQGGTSKISRWVDKLKK